MWSFQFTNELDDFSHTRNIAVQCVYTINIWKFIFECCRTLIFDTQSYVCDSAVILGFMPWRFQNQTCKRHEVFQLFWKGHKNLKKSPTCFDAVLSKQVGDFLKFYGLLISYMIFVILTSSFFSSTTLFLEGSMLNFSSLKFSPNENSSK